MADQQRVHPVVTQDPANASKPTAPLVGRGAPPSENGDPELGRQGPAPPHRTIPYKPMKPPKRRCCTCKKFICWTISLILLVILIVGILAAVVYFVYRPKLPKYSVDGLQVSQLNFGPGNSMSAEFNVNITARNPNKRIGIYYEGGSRLSVWYTDTKLCEGALPKFYQGHRNTTVMNVALIGQTQDAAGLGQALQTQQQETGNVPLVMRARVPVRLKLGGLKLMKWKFLVRCRLVVDNLHAGNDIRISNSDCNFRFRL